MNTPPVDSDHARPNEPLRGLVVSGVVWKAGAQIVGQATRLIVAVALARILAPDNYGLAAIVLLFWGSS